MDTDYDRIEREITIDAPAQRVWALVSEPAWYVNDKEIVEHEIIRDGDISYVTDPTHGRFALRTVQLDEPRYAAFRWLSDPDDLSSAATLVEFWITPTDSGVVLKVAESGFASLSGTDAERRARFDGNTEGWRIELDLARAHLTGAASRA
ncbi:SRPBCC domain-containing protein [Gordonia sp. CPCC 205515]|uniref:SRPBCC domain-containing protein n=1 Tax=Gordonia sp. CPCC 205515 TaxID=3140791 RepID=UPI003AF3A7CD